MYQYWDGRVAPIHGVVGELGELNMNDARENALMKEELSDKTFPSKMG